jgi:putative oxidoreductase
LVTADRVFADTVLVLERCRELARLLQHRGAAVHVLRGLDLFIASLCKRSSRIVSADQRKIDVDQNQRLAFFDLWQPRALAVLRIVTAYLFMTHGTAKLFGVPHQAMFDGLQLTSLVGVAGILETVGGALLLIGLLTRCAAFVLCGLMAVAYFMAHASQGSMLVPMLNQGELAVLYCFVFLYFVLSGAGAWSVDRMRR